MLVFCVSGWAETDFCRILQVMDSLYVQYLGHWGGVFSVAISNKDDVVMTGGADCSIRLYDATSGNEVKRIEGHVEAVLQVSFSLDNKKIISSSADMTAIIWDIQTGDQITRLEGHDGEVLDGIFLSGFVVLTASNDSTLRTWRVDTGQVIKSFHGHKSAVTRCISMAKGIQAVSCSFDKTIRIWEVDTGLELLMLAGHEGVIYNIDLSRDQRKLLSCASDQMVKVWNLDEGLCTETLHLHEYAVTACAFDPTGNWILTGGIDKTIRIFELGTASDAVIVGEHKAAVCSIKFSNDGEFILSASQDGVTSKWEWAVAYQVATDSTPDHTAPICYVEFSATGKHCASLSSDGVTILRVLDWRCVSLAAHQLTDVNDPATACKFAPNGLTVATLHAFGSLLWDTKTGNIVGRFAQVFNLLSLDFPDEVEYAVAPPLSPIVAPDGDMDGDAAKEALEAQDPNAFNHHQMEILKNHAKDRHKKRFRTDFLAIAKEISHLEGGRAVDWRVARDELNKLIKEEDQKAEEEKQRKYKAELEAAKERKYEESEALSRKAEEATRQEAKRQEATRQAAVEAELAIEQLMSDFRFCENCGVPWITDATSCSECSYDGLVSAPAGILGSCAKCDSAWIREGGYCHRCGSVRDRDVEDEARELGIDHEEDAEDGADATGKPHRYKMRHSSKDTGPGGIFADGLNIWFDALHRIVLGTEAEGVLVGQLVQADKTTLAQGKLDAEISVFGRELNADERDALGWNLEADAAAPPKVQVEAPSEEATPIEIKPEDGSEGKEAQDHPAIKKSMFSSFKAKSAISSMSNVLKKKSSGNVANDGADVKNESTDGEKVPDDRPKEKQKEQPKNTKPSKAALAAEKKAAAAEKKAKEEAQRALTFEMLQAETEQAVFGHELVGKERETEWKVSLSLACSYIIITPASFPVMPAIALANTLFQKSYQRRVLCLLLRLATPMI